MAEYIEKQAAVTIPVLPKEHRKYQTMNLDDAYENGWYDALECVEKLQPVDVRPVVRGRWKQTGGKYSRHKTIDRRILTCSVCGNFLHMEGVNAGRGDADFCPNCGSYNGADMRGGNARWRQT